MFHSFQFKALKPQLLLIVLLLGFSSVCQARNYHVEAIIFEQQDNSDDHELWNFSSQNLAPQFSKINELRLKTSKTQFTSRLGKLRSVEASLRQSGINILRTANWNQRARVYHLAQNMDLGAANTILPEAFIKIYKTALIFAEVNLHLSPQSESRKASVITPENAQVEARVVDLSSSATATVSKPESTSANGLLEPHYFLSERRRLKFKEIHYFDHPKFGLILGVWPVGE